MKSRLRRWLGRGRFPMDFRLKKMKAGRIGLNMGLLPGLYKGRESHEEAIHIAEDSFWFLEAGIMQHCPRYAGYDHWGVTAISREEWLKITGVRLDVE